MGNWTFMLLAAALGLALGVALIGGVVWLVLRLARGGRGWAAPAGIALIIVGLAVGLVIATMPVGSEAMDRMMSRHMAEMMGGETGRRAPAPDADAFVEEVTAGDFFFRPRELRAPRGETVNIRFTNGGRMFHTFTIAELDFDLRASPGATISGALRDAAPGTYEFVCTVPGHAQAGMRATLRFV